jgi:gas vesicle structural protein
MTTEWDELADGPEDASTSISLCETLDRVLHKGVVLRGDLVLSVADVDLVYLGLQIVLCSTDTAARAGILPSSQARAPCGGSRSVDPK